MTSAQLLSIALQIAARGQPVFPCSENKRPAIAEADGGHGHLDAVIDAHAVYQLFGRAPHARLVGVPTGERSGFDVLDTDPRHGGHLWEAAHSGQLPRTRMHRTRGGGYPVLFAAGAAALEAWIIRPILRAALIAELLTLGLVGAPFALPVLPIERFLDYQDRLGLAPEQLEHSPLGRLPEYYADMFGWPDLAAMVGRAYQALPPQDRARAVFLADNYGEAAAVDVFGGPWRLPPAISAHNNYFLWGPRGHDGSVIIRLGGNREALLKLYASVEAAGVFDNPWAMPYETGRTIWICRNREPPLDEAWSSLRNYR